MIAAVHEPPTQSMPPQRGAKKISRVVIATINRAEGDTGVHTHTRMLHDGLIEGGVQCDVISPFDGSRKWLPVFAVRPLLLHRINKTWSTLWHRKWHKAALKENLLRHLRSHPADVVIAQCPVSASAAMEVRSLLGGGFPIVLVCHFNHSEASEYRDKGELPDPAEFQAMLNVESRVLESVDRIIYVSNFARQNVEAVRGLQTRSAVVVWNGTAEAPAGQAVKRSDLGLRDDDLVLISVGSLEPRKNQLGLVDFFASLQSQYASAKLVLVGDGPARGEIEEKIAERRLKDSVILLGHRRDVPAILPGADLYVHYSTLENCPLALIEAARAGLPVAAVPAGGVPELQAALDCKFELDPADFRGTLARLQPLLTDASLRREFGQRARAAFERTFTRDSMTRAYLEALRF